MKERIVVLMMMTDIPCLHLQLLKYKPKERLSLEGIMEHPWITEHYNPDAPPPNPCKELL